MKRFCSFSIGLLICYMTFAQHPFPSYSTKAFVVELEQASTPNILKGLRESALYLRKAEYLFPD